MAELIGGASKVSFMRAEHAPTPGNFAAHAVDISGALAGVRKAALEIERIKINAAKSALPMLSLLSAYADYRMPARPNDRRTVHVLGKAKHWYADRDGQLHLAKGESPWN
jgi:hypothetical protein